MRLFKTLSSDRSYFNYSAINFSLTETLSFMFLVLLTELGSTPHRKITNLMISPLIKVFKMFNMKDISSYHPKIRLSQKKTNRVGRLMTYFFEKSLEFLAFLLYLLEIPNKTKLHPWKFCKIVFHSLGIP